MLSQEQKSILLVNDIIELLQLIIIPQNLKIYGIINEAGTIKKVKCIMRFKKKEKKL